MAPSKTQSYSPNVFRLPQIPESYRKVGVLRQCRTMYTPGKVLDSIQQVLKSSNKEETDPEELKAFRHKRQQRNQFRQVAMPQTFRHVTTMEIDGKKETPQQPTNSSRKSQ